MIIIKIRRDLVTNSSSSSYIVCFARIADEEKAKSILDEYKRDLDVYTADEVLEKINASRWSEWLECDWAGVNATPSKEYILSHKDSRFIMYEHCEDIIEDEDGYACYDVDYSDFCDTEAIESITEENGFADIDIQYGAGRNG